MASIDNKENKLLSLWNLFNIYYALVEDTIAAKNSVSYMADNFPDDHLTQLAENLMNTETDIVNQGIAKGNSTTANVEQKTATPNQFNLFQNYPNPFNPTTKITYTLKEPSNVSLRIYNILGQEVSKLVEEYQTEGFHSGVFSNSNLSSGIYFYRLTVSNANSVALFTSVKKMSLLK